MARAKRRGNHEGSIVRRNDGRWMALMTSGRDPVTGKLQRVALYGRTRQDVARKLSQALSDRSRGTFVAPHKWTVGEWLDVWLRDYKKPSLRPVSYDSYEMIVRHHLKPALGYIALKDIRPDQVQRFYNDKQDTGLSARTIRYLHTILHGALKQAMKNQLVVRNVSEATTLPGGKTRTMHPLTLEQVQQFLTAAKADRLFVGFFLEMGTGLRRGELLGVRWQDLDPEAGVLHVRQALVRVGNHDAIASDRKTRLIFQEPKTEQSRRTIPIPVDILEALKHHKGHQAEERLLMGEAYEDQGLVFCQANGQPIDPRNFSRHQGSLIDQGLSWSFDPEATIGTPVQSDDPKSRVDWLIGLRWKHDKESSIHTGGVGDNARHEILAFGHFSTLAFVSGLLPLTTHVVLDMSTYRELTA